jgi:hypothetical protein
MSDERLKLAVTITDCVHAAHVNGADVVTEVRTFELTPEACAFIAEVREKARRSGYMQISLALHVEAKS